MTAEAEVSILVTALPYAPLVLTIIGWYVANHASSKREIRKEKRAEVDACCKMLFDILGKARIYYTKDVSDPDSIKIERELVFDLHRILQRIERLEKTYPKFDASSTCGELHEAITGGSFESQSRQPLTHNDPAIMQIEYWTHKTMDQLEEGFIATF